MDKRLDDMTNDELGELFPIIISEPDPNWAILFHEEESRIKHAVGKANILSIEHIGSTAVSNLKAKPTIDILLIVPAEIDHELLIERLKGIDYHFIPKPENPAPHMMFVKGYTIEGYRGQAYHVHVRYQGDWDELHFRDYLQSHPDITQEYSELKVRLSEEYPNDREGYTNKKAIFIERVVRMARSELSR
jgi:GrpB-like predicted nucleotidyltransferase (UPF0157 family)